MRILVDVTPAQLDALNTIAGRSSSRAEVIRQALDSFVAAHREPLTAFFGEWSGNPETQDVTSYLDGILREWEC